MKNIAFLAVTDMRDHSKVTEAYYLRYWEYCKIVFVSESELSQEIKFRLMAVCPAAAAKIPKERLEKHAGCPKFVFGHYHDPDKLLLMDDFIQYNHSHLKFEEIRTARMINKELLEKANDNCEITHN